MNDLLQLKESHSKSKIFLRRIYLLLFYRLSGKEKTLKEIRCLAVLNHPNLIQYYYAWNESPPEGWQDEEDKKLIIKNTEAANSLSSFPTSVASDDGSGPATQSLPSPSSLPPVIDFTFERSLNPPQVHEDSHSSVLEHSYDSTDDEDKVISKSSIEEDCPTSYFYFVMELCQSESLRDRLTKQTINQSQGWLIFDQIIQGIEYIHSQKLIHRDLKPSNILFSMDNIVKIGDFGLVAAFGEDKIENIDHAGNNELGGTILYMSPEQINRQFYNQKIDIYAIGIILFELLQPFSTQMERICALKDIRLQTPIFPNDFKCDESIVRINCVVF
jgi:serine/threonine protein kinase